MSGYFIQTTFDASKKLTKEIKPKRKVTFSTHEFKIGPFKAIRKYKQVDMVSVVKQRFQRYEDTITYTPEGMDINWNPKKIGRPVTRFCTRTERIAYDLVEQNIWADFWDFKRRVAIRLHMMKYLWVDVGMWTNICCEQDLYQIKTKEEWIDYIRETAENEVDHEPPHRYFYRTKEEALQRIKDSESNVIHL